MRSDALDLAFLSIVEELDRRGLELHKLAQEPLAAVLPRSDAASRGVRTVALRGPGLAHRSSLCWREGNRHAPAARALLEQARVPAAV